VLVTAAIISSCPAGSKAPAKYSRIHFDHAGSVLLCKAFYPDVAARARRLRLVRSARVGLQPGQLGQPYTLILHLNDLDGAVPDSKSHGGIGYFLQFLEDQAV
jgi:hypothetical protein